MNIEEEIAEAIHNAAMTKPEGEAVFEHEIECVRLAAAVMPLVKRAQAEAWEDARRSVRTLPHWYNTDDRYGEFDLQPLGPDETSEAGAFMAVMGVLEANPYIENEGERT